MNPDNSIPRIDLFKTLYFHHSKTTIDMKHTINKLRGYYIQWKLGIRSATCIAHFTHYLHYIIHFDTLTCHITLVKFISLYKTEAYATSKIRSICVFWRAFMTSWYAAAKPVYDIHLTHECSLVHRHVHT